MFVCLYSRPEPKPSPHGHVIACRITAENPDEVSQLYCVMSSYTELYSVFLTEISSTYVLPSSYNSEFY